jgi:hypothetical protein
MRSIVDVQECCPSSHKSSSGESMRRRKDPNAWFQEAIKVSKDPAASDWLKLSLLQAINRDPGDAAKDAQVLSRILEQRAAAAATQPSSSSNVPAKQSRE